MGDKRYQLVYKSCYHGELYDDPRAISISPLSSACDILEIIEISEIPVPEKDFGSGDGSAKRQEEKYRHSFEGGIGSYFTDKAAAIAALRALD